MRSSSGIDLEGSSAAKRSATALARCSGDTQKRYLDGALYGQGESAVVPFHHWYNFLEASNACLTTTQFVFQGYVWR